MKESNILACIIYRHFEEYTGLPISHLSSEFQFNEPVDRLKFFNSIFSELIEYLGYNGDVKCDTSKSRGFVDVFDRGVFKDCILIEVSSIYQNLMTSINFTVPKFNECLKGLMRIRADLKRKSMIMLDGKCYQDNESIGKSFAIKLFINSLYGMSIHPKSLLKSDQNVAHIGYGMMAEVAKCDGVISIDTDAILVQDITLELDAVLSAVFKGFNLEYTLVKTAIVRNKRDITLICHTSSK